MPDASGVTVVQDEPVVPGVPGVLSKIDPFRPGVLAGLLKSCGVTRGGAGREMRLIFPPGLRRTSPGPNKTSLGLR